MNTIAGSRSSSPSASSSSVRRGAERQPWAGPASAPMPGPGRAAGPSGRAAMGLAAHPAVDEQVGRTCRLAAAVPVVHGQMVAEDDRPAPLDDDIGRTADRPEPRAEVGGVGDGGREADERDARRGEDEDLFPDAAPVRVLEVVDLVEDDRAQAVQQVGAGEEHVAQHLRRHDDDRGVRAYGDVAGQQADRVCAVLRGQLAELLVRSALSGVV